MEVRSGRREEGDERDEEEEEEEEEEEYVLLDLDNVYQHGHLPENVPYFLSGLDTLNPRLIIGDGLTLIGKYEETIGTCYIFSETDNLLGLTHKETGPSEANLFKEKSIVGHSQSPSRQVKLIAGLHKILKFKMVAEDESVTAVTRKDDAH